jgi:DNA-binding NarL/FixJ family response regulator
MLITRIASAYTVKPKMRRLERFETEAVNEYQRGAVRVRREHSKAHSTPMIDPRRHAAETRILVVDEHPLFRHGVMDFINGQIDMAVCGSADSIPSAQMALTGCKPDLILLGLRLGTGDTLEFIKALRAHYPKLLILVFSQFEETIFAERAVRAGANGYLMKYAPNEELLTAIREIVHGGIYVSRKSAYSPSRNRSKPRGKTTLERTSPTSKICQIAKYTFSGCSVRDLAQERSPKP